MRIVVGVSGGIAAYKTPQLIRLLVTAGHEVRCAATSHALEFVTQTVLETVSCNKLYCDLFSHDNGATTEHISLKDWADAVIVAPATANIIGKMACGIADDALSTLLISACRKPIFVCPAMNTQMWENPALQLNLKKLASFGVHIIGPEKGLLACGAEGCGRMTEPEGIVREFSLYFNDGVYNPLPVIKKRVLVTAGPTYERLDPVRFIGNYSTGKMGFALANVLAASGAEVELVAGPVESTLYCDPRVHRTDVESAEEMFEAATALFDSCDAGILAAAVADYRPEHREGQKIKKNGERSLDLHLVENPDILATLGKRKREGQTLIGFALETENEFSHAQQKLERKNLDFIVLNSLRDAGAGFGYDTNKITIISSNGTTWESRLKSKLEIAKDIVQLTFSDK